MNRLVLVLFTFYSSIAWGQKFGLEKSLVTFFSDATIEDIAAQNSKSSAILISETGDVAFAIPIREFIFDKSLMQEHFNEKYLESEKFPKATFQGKITGYQLNASGPQPAIAKGKLTIHGITREIEVQGTVESAGQKIFMKSKFIVKLDDYGISRPQLLWQNIAEQVEVSVDFTFKPYDQK